MTLTDRQELLFDWVKIQHGDQQRKYTLDPYWHHLLSVATIVFNGLEGKNPRNEVEIAICHDLLEDTSATKEQLEAKLLECRYRQTEIYRIVSGVVDLTDEFTHEKYPDLNRSERKRREANRLAGIQPHSQTVKYADLIDNTSSIVERDPGFAKVYLREKGSYIKRIYQGNMSLYGEVLRCYTLACEKIFGQYAEE